MTGPTSERYAQILVWWVQCVRRRAAQVVVLALLATAAAAALVVAELEIDTRNEGLIADDVPYRLKEIEFAAQFPHFDDVILMVVDADVPEAADAATQALVESLLDRPDLFASVYAPSADPFFRKHGLLYSSPEDLEALVNDLAGGQALLAALAEDPSLRGLFDVLGTAFEAIGDGESAPADFAPAVGRIAEIVEAQLAGRPHRLSWQSLIQPQDDDPLDRRRFVLVQATEDTFGHRNGDALSEVRRLSGSVETAADGPDALRIRVTGGPALDAEELETVSLGGTTAGILSLVLVSGLLLAGLRSSRLIFAVLTTLIIGLIMALAFATIAVGRLNLLSVAFAVLFVGLAVDFGIHFALRYSEAMKGIVPHADALARATAGVGGALTLSAVCAAIGFFSFVPTAYRGLAELGIIAGSSMAVALFTNLTILPAMLTILPVIPQAPSRPPAVVDATKPLRRRSTAIIVITGIVTLGALLLVPSTQFDVNPLNLKDPDTESVSTFLDLSQDSRSSPYRIDLLAADLDAAEQRAWELELHPLVAEALTLSSFVPEDQDEKFWILDEAFLFLGPVLDPQTPRPPPSSEERRESVRNLAAILSGTTVADGNLAQAADRLERALNTFISRADGHAYELLETSLVGWLPQLLDDLRTAFSAEPVSLETLPDNLRSRWVASDGRARIELRPAEDVSDNRAMRRFAEEILMVAPSATGTPVSVTEGSNVVVGAFRTATLITIAGIVLVLIVVERRLSQVAVTLVPLVLAGLFTLAAAVLIGVPLNFANIIALPLLFGLGVSSSIHMVMRRAHEGAGRALLRTSTPRAVFYSALTTAASFGSLAVSPHRGMASMGLLLTIAILFTLVCTLIILPALMDLIDRRGGDST